MLNGFGLALVQKFDFMEWLKGFLENLEFYFSNKMLLKRLGYSLPSPQNFPLLSTCIIGCLITNQTSREKTQNGLR